MIYRFGPCELDVGAHELHVDGQPIDLEPQVFALLALLVENRERLVTKDEIIEKVWDGRAISDAAIASRVKSARRVLGDDGASQRMIKTLRGLGFRFVAPVAAAHGSRTPPFSSHALSTDSAERTPPISSDQTSRPSLAVLPFRRLGDRKEGAALALALPAELITELSHLRWLLVTARGSSFRLSAAPGEIGEVGRLLGVRYCLTGTIESAGSRLAITVELLDARDAGVVWARRFVGRLEEVHAIREEIRSEVLVALEIRIPIHEAALARGKPAESIDAWSIYHLGLQHMYRFNRVDNAAATGLFERAVALDPCFARAYAGLSFMHFQTAFMRYSDDLRAHLHQARSYAERGVELDPLDPFVNFAMGRTYWLEGDLASSLTWLERATQISPHYAQGIYAKAWTEALSGRAADSLRNVDLAMRLSPLDPLHYAMLGTRALAHIAAHQDAEAAAWAERAARSPGAHVLIAMIATAAHALHGERQIAAEWAANVRERNGALTRDDFARAFPMKPPDMRERVLGALASFGF